MLEENIVIEEAAPPVIDVQNEPDEESVFEITEYVIAELFKNVQARKRDIWASAKFDLSVVSERQRKFALELVCNAVQKGGYLLLHKAFVTYMDQYPSFTRGKKQGQYIRFDK